MRNERVFIDNDVYNESKKRISHIIDIFDNVAVCFSGGKDSLAVLNLVEEVYSEKGIKQKIKVIFRDEELIPDDVINFVIEKYKSGKYDFLYFAIPLKSNKYILGKTYEYVQWDKNRKHLRNPPDFAIRLDDGDDRVFDQYSADTFICQNMKGSVALLTGVRAQESLVRYQACMVKKNENYINDTKDNRIKICKPIYDWSENDIFLYFYKKKIRYCPIYDLQTLNDDNLRVSTPLHAESAKRFYKIKTLYPTFYQQLVDLFPEILVQSMYFKEYKRSADYLDYEHSFNGIKKYIKEKFEDVTMMKKALKEVGIVEKTRQKAGKNSKNFGGYPLLHVFKQIANGNFKRHILPKRDVSKEELDYENMQN